MDKNYVGAFIDDHCFIRRWQNLSTFEKTVKAMIEHGRPKN